ncbi:lactosylceramide 4-alpha-galactosyltransferase-like [Daktulosphaira vitifoliae]|uniref:lactosylceramide 4-alpha-galactosyltransferase-like n=1 Tax=Daktulosphaira vitifoliae TaxID=58002 RepID=UPI0021A9E31C|nr:lactosylceramide 4-alpha-galactosyltransferase-like [Daktulosphaira vitifoliae]
MVWLGFKKMYVQIVLILIIPLIFLYNINFSDSIKKTLNKEKYLVNCHFEEPHIDSLIELNSNEVAKNSIFFVETSCNHKNGIKLNLRQGCAIESAARLNPSSKIFVLYLSPSSVENKSEVLIKLQKYKNINLRYVNLRSYSANTPAQNFVTSNTIYTSNWPVSHTSDLLRFLTLWKFGGTYLDLDVVLLKSLGNFSNFVSKESDDSIASLVLNFGTDDLGKSVANTAINDYVNNYRGYNWGYNGPGVITRTLQKMCNTNSIVEMNKDKCQGFTIFDSDAFCPVRWEDWYNYFNASMSDEIMNSIKNSIGIHVWNQHSKNTNIFIGSKQPYGLVAQSYCPEVFSLARHIF